MRNVIIDLALLVFFFVVAFSSVVLFFFLPSGGGGGAHAGSGATNFGVFLGVARGEWVDFHTITGLLFMVLMAVHILCISRTTGAYDPASLRPKRRHAPASERSAGVEDILLSSCIAPNYMI